MEQFFATVNSILVAIDDFIWGVPLMVLILAGGILLTVRLRGLQFSKLPRALRYMMKNEKGEDAHGEVSSFGALCTALSATIGTGNIVGVATAIVAGGPGAMFWMWLAALFGMATKYSEGLLAVKYRSIDEDGHVLGGPFYYIERGMKQRLPQISWRWLAKIFAFFGMCVGLFGIGTFTQVNSINSAITGFFDPNMAHTVSLFGMEYSLATVIGSLVVAIFVGLVVIGGLKRISSVAQKIIPIMVVVYVGFSLVLIVVNITALPDALVTIVESAFGLRAAAGGALGAIIIAMQKGIARGIFSNEAGLGTGSIAHACADTIKPVKQGMFGIFEVFADTIVICTLTALVILCGGEGIQYGVAAGAELTISGFVTTYGSWVTIFTAIAMCCFAFSTILGWGLYGARCVEFVFTTKVVKPFMIVYALVAILGATVDLGIIWGIADTCNGLMSIPNLIALFLLSGTVAKLVKDYFEIGRASCRERV